MGSAGEAPTMQLKPITTHETLAESPKPSLLDTAVPGPCPSALVLRPGLPVLDQTDAARYMRLSAARPRVLQHAAVNSMETTASGIKRTPGSRTLPDC